MVNDLSASTARLNIHGSTQATATVPTGPVTPSVKLPQSNLSHLHVMSRLGHDFGSSSEPPLMKTLRFRLSTRMFGGVAKNIVGRNSFDCKNIRRDQQNSARKIWKYEPHDSSPTVIFRSPTSRKICHARRIEHHIHRMSSLAIMPFLFPVKTQPNFVGSKNSDVERRNEELASQWGSLVLNATGQLVVFCVSAP